MVYSCLYVEAQDNVEQIAKPLETWAKDFPQEKVHVHTDKPYYMAGDTIWFKAYTVIGAHHQLSSLSGALYVDLISSTDSVVSSLKLPLMAGMAKGNIDLPVELRSGNYRLRAYTQWMRNAGSDYFFDRPLYIGALSQTGTQAAAKLTLDDQKKGKAVGMDIHFLDMKGAPLTDKPVDYTLRTNSELLSHRKVKTDAQGMLHIAFDEKDLRDTTNAFIVSEIELEKKLTATHVFPITVQYTAANVQFFPESGDLVGGMPSRVAFKAIGENGLGISISGTIVDEQNQSLITFNSVHAGMGSFMLTPETGKKYQAKVTFPNGETKNCPLPEVKSSGYILSVYPQEANDTIMVRIMSSADRLKQPVQLVAQMDGEIFYAAELNVVRPLTSLYVPLEQHQSGIVQFTLFHEGQATNERLTYIPRPDTLVVKLNGLADAVKPRSESVLDFLVTDVAGKPIVSNLSMAVIDESQVPVKEEKRSTILSQLLLQANLKGYIEDPNYYFTNISNERLDHLDLLLMTQGYRRFVWKDLLQGKIGKPTYPAEKITSSISGKLLTLRNGKPVPNGKITLFSTTANIALETKTDTEGKFTFDSLFLTDNIKFTIQGRTEKGSDKVEISLDGIPSLAVTPNKNTADFSLNVNQQLNTYFESTQKHDAELSNLGLESRMIKLNEVIVNARVEKKLPISHNLNGAGRADQVISGNELGTCPTLRMCLEGRLHGVVFKVEQTDIGPVSFPNSTRGGKMLLVVDNKQYNTNSDAMDILGIFEQNLIDPTQILSIEVMRSPSLTNMYGQAGANGVILINTKGWTPNERTDYSAQLYAPKGFSVTREFYSPKYRVSERLDALADQRSTVYWNPAISIDKTGKGQVRYFNTKNPGWYRIEIEGIGANGQLGRKVFRYQIAK
ncbi:TonB-dependent receptor plug domain-containing protein [Olivibacter ginsenosidimutans]|uniref:TonB-dependent receptor plug domain-containing protein n=1 Tax=Olivibacter ginsenosidimutans TaxID=1176537 RepID=A0ABP9CFX4_9SPHI